MGAALILANSLMTPGGASVLIAVPILMKKLYPPISSYLVVRGKDGPEGCGRAEHVLPKGTGESVWPRTVSQDAIATCQSTFISTEGGSKEGESRGYQRESQYKGPPLS